MKWEITLGPRWCGFGNRWRVFPALVLVLAAPVSTQLWAEQVADDEYIFRLSGCVGCHTREGEAVLAGGPGLKTPFGTFYAPNITPDPIHGIGQWSDEDLLRALGRGVSPDGSHYFPVFPYGSYTRMTAADMRAIYRHLARLPASATPRREHDLPWYLGFRFLNWFWKLLFFDEGPYGFDSKRSDSWNRGGYIALALSHCGECHSPRNFLGAIDPSRHLAGNPNGVEDDAVPNITPNKDSGIGLWSPSDIVDYLTSGALPDGDYAGGAMAEVIDAGLQHLTAADAAALAHYLGRLPALESAAP